MSWSTIPKFIYMVYNQDHNVWCVSWCSISVQINAMHLQWFTSALMALRVWSISKYQYNVLFTCVFLIVVRATPSAYVSITSYAQSGMLWLRTHTSGWLCDIYFWCHIRDTSVMNRHFAFFHIHYCLHTFVFSYVYCLHLFRLYVSRYLRCSRDSICCHYYFLFVLTLFRLV